MESLARFLVLSLTILRSQVQSDMAKLTESAKCFILLASILSLPFPCQAVNTDCGFVQLRFVSHVGVEVHPSGRVHMD